MKIDELLDGLTSLRSQSELFLKNLQSSPSYKEIKGTKKVNLEQDSIESIIESYFGNVHSEGINTASSKFLGFIPGGGLPTTALADFCSALTNPYSGFYEASPYAQEIEYESVK